jgi:hypothetical protein
VSETTTRIPPFRVDLSKTEWIVFDYKDEFFRVAYYRPWHDGDRQPRANVSRFACSRHSFHEALNVVFAESDARHDASIVEHYVRSTAWGADLPE